MGFQILSNTANVALEDIAKIVELIKTNGSSKKGLLGREENFVLKEKNLHLKIVSAGGVFSRLPFGIRCSLGLRKLNREIKALKLAQKLSLPAPKVLGQVIVKIGLARIGFVVTEFIEGSTLVELCREDPEKAKASIGALESVLNKLTRAKLFHKDLHPGNVFVSQNDVYLLDWGSIEPFYGPLDSAYSKYLKRWRRACIKYDLPFYLISYFCSIASKLREYEPIY
ncbi:MAG: AarF/UbiB family protein [Deltaproteobacteria bacterium]|nr:AarF/UbiB family protein [Deltaproteobacteria bacterium]MCX7952617.1 AarF/UbiB family protein [Deltaproteobacteria bacterium]